MSVSNKDEKFASAIVAIGLIVISIVLLVMKVIPDGKAVDYTGFVFFLLGCAWIGGVAKRYYFVERKGSPLNIAIGLGALILGCALIFA